MLCCWLLTLYQLNSLHNSYKDKRSQKRFELWEFLFLNFNIMEIKKYLGFWVREDGFMLNEKNNSILKSHINDYGDVIVNAGNDNEMLKNIIACLFFDFDINFQLLIKVGHLDNNKENCSVENLKIYNAKDKFNKSGKYIILFAEEYLVFHRKGLISKYKDLRTAFNHLS